MKKHLTLLLPIFFIVSCSGKKSNSENTVNSKNLKLSSLANNISGKTWCLNDSITIFLENDTTEQTPLTETFEFKPSGDVIFKYLYKQTREVYQTVNASWSTDAEKLILTGNGDYDISEAYSDGDELRIFSAIEDSSTESSLYFNCTN